MSTREFWANEAAMMRDKSGVLGKEVLMPIVSPIFGNTPLSVDQCSETWAITSVWNVRSLELEKHDIDTESAWNLVKKKYSIAKREAEQTIKDVGARIPVPQKEIVSQLLNENPWSYTIQSINNGIFNWRQYVLDYAKHTTLENEHLQLIANLSSNDLKGFKDSMKDFRLELRKFIDKLNIYNDENKNEIGYNRFNEFYESSNLSLILDKIPLIKFTAAEVKALNMQETGDFTNKTIVAFKNKSSGLTSNVASSGTGIVGLCQLPLVSAQEAYIWTKNVKIAEFIKLISSGASAKTMSSDRENTENAIYLTGAYLGRIVEILSSELGQISGCKDKKRIVFSAYNAGPGTLKKAINSFLSDNKGVDLTWDNANFQKKLQEQTKFISSTKYSETKKYAPTIEKRLTLK